ncbi:hypothetical protein [Rhodoplanes roseus]|uniref:Uncharacterized protein n=1 Tax=Rhodoplanes roseus TaxID=29409 RepID=A0A327L6J0_9BRAD|nr:hypothetical protein [Rhodoplanes roseus]RAI45523.1 hypothetical protein CH341_03360 [Rhodoplanes roseus]
MREFVRRYLVALFEAVTRVRVRSTAVERMNGLVGASFVVLFVCLLAANLIEPGTPLAQALCMPLAGIAVALAALITLELVATIRKIV